MSIRSTESVMYRVSPIMAAKKGSHMNMEDISGLTWSWSRRFNTLFLSGFALVAFLLVSIGVYGVMANSVSQRTHVVRDMSEEGLAARSERI